MSTQPKQPISPLIHEHRLIEKMIGLLRVHLDRLRRGEPPEFAFLDDAADFFLFYADRTHHGKEEQILFPALAGRELTPVHRQLVEVLTAEHARARALVRRLATAAAAGRRGEEQSRETMVAALAELVELYPLHIAKEDADLLIPAMRYFSPQEQESLLREFKDFDQRLIHHRYRAVVDRWSGT